MEPILIHVREDQCGECSLFVRRSSSKRIHQNNGPKTQENQYLLFRARSLSSGGVTGCGSRMGLPHHPDPEDRRPPPADGRYIARAFLPTVLFEGRSELPVMWEPFFPVNLSIFLTQRGCCERNWGCYRPCLDTVCKMQGGRQQTKHSVLVISLKGAMCALSSAAQGAGIPFSQEIRCCRVISWSISGCRVCRTCRMPFAAQWGSSPHCLEFLCLDVKVKLNANLGWGDLTGEQPVGAY